LVHLDVVADDAGFADHHAGAVIEKEALAELSAGVDVDTRTAVSVLTDDPRDHRDLLTIQKVRDAVGGDRFDRGITEDDFFEAARRRVAFESRQRVAVERLSKTRDLVEHPEEHLVRMIGPDLRPAACSVLVSDGSPDLSAQELVRRVQVFTQRVAQVLWTERPQAVEP